MMIIEKELKNENREEKFHSNEEIDSINKAVNKIFSQGISDLKFLAKGGSSKIYEGKINKGNVYVIIKVLENDKNINNNINEVKILQKVKNKHIITMYGYSIGKNNEYNFIMMEKGKYDLRIFLNKVLKRRTYSESLLNYICSQIMKGLFYLYRSNIIHYDIKPQNIIINDILEAKIIDFSVSLDISNIKEKEVKLHYRGTSYYMAPEVIKQKKIKLADYHKIDLFSLGVMLYVLSFGERPFNLSNEDCDNDDIIYNKMNSDWKVENIQGREYSSHFINFLNGLLEKNIEKRMNIYEAMNHYWIKGANILMEEKENIYNANAFLTNLVTDHFSEFNDFMNNSNFKLN